MCPTALQNALSPLGRARPVSCGRLGRAPVTKVNLLGIVTAKGIA